MMEKREHYLVICEGASEFAYTQVLNRFLNENNQSLILSAHNAESGNLKVIRNHCRAMKCKMKAAIVMLDYDIYERNDNNNLSLYEQHKDRLPKFCFQHFNFEDFLLMHYPPAILDKWRSRMKESGHYASPLHENEYLAVFNRFVCEHENELQFSSTYQKGDMPFMLTSEKLRNLFVNNRNSELPRSDFATFLQSHIVLPAFPS